MRTSLLLPAIIALATLTGSALGQTQPAPAKETAPDVPDAIAVPTGQEVVMFAHATGSQIYSCQPGADGKFSWALKAPDAELKDRNDKVIGQHSAGPTWTLKTGSEVTGKAVAHVDSLDAISGRREAVEANRFFCSNSIWQVERDLSSRELDWITALQAKYSWSMRLHDGVLGENSAKNGQYRYGR